MQPENGAAAAADEDDDEDADADQLTSFLCGSSIYVHEA